MASGRAATRDSLGGAQTYAGGSAQWMRTGAGVRGVDLVCADVVESSKDDPQAVPALRNCFILKGRRADAVGTRRGEDFTTYSDVLIAAIGFPT